MTITHLRDINKRAIYWLICAALCFHKIASANDTASHEFIQAELDQIEVIAGEDSPKALERLFELQDSIDNSTALSLRQQFLSQLAYVQVETGRIDEAWSSAIALEHLGIEHNDRRSLADGHAQQGLVLLARGENREAVEKFHLAIELAEAIPDHGLARHAYNNLANTENILGNFEASLKYFYKAIDHIDPKSEKRSRQMSVLLNNISLLYLSMKAPEKGLKIIEQAFLEAEKSGRKDLFSTLLLNRGYAYDDLGQMEKAFESYMLGLTASREIQSIRGESIALINLSDYYLRKEDYQLSEQYGLQSLATSEKTGDESLIATAKANIGMALAGRGLVDEGAKRVNAAIELFMASNSLLEAEGTLEDLAKLYRNSGMYEKALDAILKKMDLSEALYQSEREKSLTEMQEKFAAVERQKRIESLEAENKIKGVEIKNNELQQKVTLLAAALTVLVLALMVMLYRKAREANTKLQDANSKLHRQSISDPLTGLLNRRSFLSAMQSRTASAKRRQNEAPPHEDALILIDVDHFKQVNDKHGHAAGDAVLIELSKRLKHTLRESDMILRWGGEEFLVLAKESSCQNTKKIIGKILEAINGSSVSIGAKEVPVTVSIGAINLPFDGLSENDLNWEAALKIADMALYLSKAHGRNRAYMIERLLTDYDDVKEILESDLIGALEAKKVELSAILGKDSPE